MNTVIPRIYRKPASLPHKEGILEVHMNTNTIISVLERILSEKYGQEVKLVAGDRHGED